MDVLFKEGIEDGIALSHDLSVEFGPGKKRSIPGAITIDKVDLDTVDIIYDLAKGIPLPDASVQYAFSSHFFGTSPRCRGL